MKSCSFAVVERQKENLKSSMQLMVIVLVS